MWQNPNPDESLGNTLFILRLVVEGQKIDEWENDDMNDNTADMQRTSIATLLHLAGEEARQWGLEKVEIWNPNAVTLEAAKMISRKSRLVDREEESIPSLRWAGQEGEELIWLGNEKYAWC
jgi:hypothetical protein